MTTRLWQSQRIAMLAAGIAMSMVSMAWGQELYQTRSDGSIWEYTGTPCNEVTCPGWIELDNNSNMSMIAAGGGALFEMHKDGSIWWYIGPACSEGSCPGWVELDNNPLAIAIGAGGNGTPYEVHQDGSLWEYNGVICTGGTCPGWTELENNTIQGGEAGAYYGVNGAILVWQSIPTTCSNIGISLSLFGGTPNIWTGIDESNNGFAVGATALYEMTSSGEVRQYNASPITYDWLTIDNNPRVDFIVAGGSGLYELRANSTAKYSVWEYTGTPCDGATCPGWVHIDNHTSEVSLVAGADVAGSKTVYEMRYPSAGGVSIWQYNGTPCDENVCSGWVPLDANAKTTSIVAGPVPFPTYPGCAGF
ncbi:MAG: hypothetical protein ABSG56_11090 [Bryobacteraceae bacterium]